MATAQVSFEKKKKRNRTAESRYGEKAVRKKVTPSREHCSDPRDPPRTSHMLISKIWFKNCVSSHSLEMEGDTFSYSMI